MRRQLIAASLIAGALAPAIGFSQPGWSQAESERVGIRLLEAPSERREDPRARQYVIDHLRPGDTITRRFEVENLTAERKVIQLYSGAATIEESRFLAAEGRAGNDLARWTEVEPPEVTLIPGGKAEARLTIAVPANATDGERYAAVWAEQPPTQTASGVTLVNRVGIRIYLSVGEGQEPESDFIIDEFVAARDDEGRPLMRAIVENTGGRALDLSGELKLENGPGSLSAGPFRVELGTTLAPGDRAPAVVLLDPQLPDGPWDATITIRSGELEKSATAQVRFPKDAGDVAEPVKAKPVTGTTAGRVLLAIAGVLLLGVLGFFFLVFWRRRRDREEEREETLTPVP